MKPVAAGLFFASVLLLLPVTVAFAGTDEPLLLDNVVTGPTTRQAAMQPTYDVETAAQRSVAEFLGHFSGYEQMYFIAGPVDPLAKFQFSFKYRLFNEGSPLAKKVPLLGGLHFSYTQLSLWELDKNSAPFFDTNYMPEVFYSNEDIKLKLPFVSQWGVQTGFEHDSNGQAGAISRSINLLFIRPIFTIGDIEGFHAYVAPQLYSYIGDLSNNPDIYHYRGYCDLRGVIGWRQGLELSAIARAGARWNKGGVQVDLTYPLRDVLDKNLDVYLDAQYFNGYGESLLTYNQRTNAFRIGFALVR